MIKALVEEITRAIRNPAGQHAGDDALTGGDAPARPPSRPHPAG